jgi:hypothetical protein
MAQGLFRDVGKKKQEWQQDSWQAIHHASLL